MKLDLQFLSITLPIPRFDKPGVVLRRLIFDGNNNLFRSAYRAASRFGQKEPMWNSTTISTFIYSVRSLVAQFLPETVFVVWDGGRSIRRRVLYPEYKQHRSEKTYVDDMNRVKSDIESILTKLKCRIICLPGREADDVISLIATKYRDNNIIVSDDSDYFQLIQKGAKIFRPLTQQFLSNLNFKEIYKVSPGQHLLSKAVLGDTADNIIGIPGVGPVTLSDILDKFPDIKDVNELVNAALSDEFKGKRRVRLLAENRELIDKNFELLDTEKEIFTEKELLVLENSIKSNDVCFDESAVVSVLHELGLTTVLQFFTEWSTPFRTLH